MPGVSKKRAFTLLELLIIIIITGILVAVLLPAIQGIRENAKRVACVNNLRQIYFASELYAQDHNDYWVSVWKFMPLNPSEIIWNNTIKDELGNLYPNYIDDLKVFYCPGGKKFYEAFFSPNSENWTSNPSYFGINGYYVITSYYCYRASQSQGKLYNLKDVAIVRDTSYYSFYYKNHKYGYNSLYGNGTIVWTKY